LIDAFERIVDPIHSRLFITVKENGDLAETRDVLLPKLLSGELRTPDAEREPTRLDA